MTHIASFANVAGMSGYGAFRHHVAIRNAVRGNMAAGIAARSAHRFTGGTAAGIGAHVTAFHTIVRHAHMIAVESSAMFEIAVPHRGHVFAIGVVAMGDIDSSAAATDRNADVEGRESGDADRERGNVHFAESEREPADDAIGDDDARIEIGKDDQRGSVDGTQDGDGHGRDPPPGASDVHPAPIMERSPAPRGVIDPGPTPHRGRKPVTVAIRSPIRREIRREPGRAIRSHHAPDAALIEIGVAREIARNEVRGLGHQFALIALRAE
jgi:hypothetical protein